MLIALFAFLAGAALGALLAWLYLRPKLQSPEQLRETFAQLASQTLQNTVQQSTQHLLQLATNQLGHQTEKQEQTLEGKKALIDQTLGIMQAELKKVADMVQTLEKDRQAKFENLATQLGQTGEQLKTLHGTTRTLSAALTNSHVRGQWGDRMADDVLRMAGMVEGITYRRQAALQTGTTSRPRPDYTFLLPDFRVIHMDVKFPMAAYLTHLDATTEHEREQSKKQFIRDAKARVAEAAQREYRAYTSIPEEVPLDYVLVFIPNEQVYGFLMEHAGEVMDDALRQKVILCSPTTLLAVLAVIRQAVENFNLERRTSEIFNVLNAFQHQWEKFTESMGKLGDRLRAASQEYETLLTTRRNQLDRQLDKLSALPHPTPEQPQTLIAATKAEKTDLLN